ncbi:MAG: hypothetical protein HC802_21535 [Caldilineaceae bacterium]|nr:hypothetical protein [Caldilineaceae bacterium]
MTVTWIEKKQGTRMNQCINFFAITLVWLLFGLGSAQAQIDWPANLVEPPNATEPTTVEMSLYLDDVSRIDVAPIPMR